MSEEELVEAIWPSVARLNQEVQEHSRLLRNMLVVVPQQTEALEKSSKGTIIRKAAKERFNNYIDASYDFEDSNIGTSVEDGDVLQYLLGLVQTIVPKAGSLTEDLDLFSYGVDSIACMQLRKRLRPLIP